MKTPDNLPDNLPGRFHGFDSPASLSQALAQHISRELADASAERRASLAVSGGRTPIQLFEQLSPLPLSWQQIDITLIDERCVPADHTDSNAGLVQRHLLQQHAQQARFLPLYQQEESTEALNQRLSQLHWPLDVAILGMGNDGHTASLFPAAAELEAGLDPAQSQLCLSLTPPSAPHRRLTLSRRAISASKTLILHLQGDDKLATLEQALAGDDIRAMPIRAFLALPQLHIYWCP